MGDQLQTDDPDEDRRQRLRARGWHETAGTLFSGRKWCSPAGRILHEDEAFRELEREEEKE